MMHCLAGNNKTALRVHRLNPKYVRVALTANQRCPHMLLDFMVGYRAVHQTTRCLHMDLDRSVRRQEAHEALYEIACGAEDAQRTVRDGLSALGSPSVPGSPRQVQPFSLHVLNRHVLMCNQGGSSHGCSSCMYMELVHVPAMQACEPLLPACVLLTQLACCAFVAY